MTFTASGVTSPVTIPLNGASGLVAPYVLVSFAGWMVRSFGFTVWPPLSAPLLSRKMPLCAKLAETVWGAPFVAVSDEVL